MDFSPFYCLYLCLNPINCLLLARPPPEPPHHFLPWGLISLGLYPCLCPQAPKLRSSLILCTLIPLRLIHQAALPAALSGTHPGTLRPQPLLWVSASHSSSYKKPGLPEVTAFPAPLKRRLCSPTPRGVQVKQLWAQGTPDV